MTRHVFSPTGGTPWDDLEIDRPWFDECAEADYLQDRQQAWDTNPPPFAAVARERFGDVDQIAGELTAAPGLPPELVRHVARPGWERDELTHRRRRRILNDTLGPDPTIVYRRGRAS